MSRRTKKPKPQCFGLLIESGIIGDPEGKAAGQSMYNATMVSSGFWLQHLCEAGASLREGNRLIVQAMNGRIKGRLDNGVDIDGKSNLGGTANRLKKGWVPGCPFPAPDLKLALHLKKTYSDHQRLVSRIQV